MKRIQTKIWIITIAITISLITLPIFFLQDSGVLIFENFDNIGNSDVDHDGVSNTSDNCPQNSNPSQLDFDKDTMGDECDIDDDNDKIIDSVDSFDLDQSEWADFDFDGIGSNQDSDDDNDGILDNEDPTPLLASQELAEKYIKEIQDCSLLKGGTPRLLCNSQFFHDLVENEDNNENVLELALALSKIKTIDDCHFVSHIIGHAAYDENPDIYENIIPTQSSTCRGGFYHGVIGEHFNKLKENGEDISDYEEICDVLIGSANYQNCVHGLGHGLVRYYVDDLSSALDSCHKMSYYQNSVCMGGAMMQYTDNKLRTSPSIDEEFPLICSKSDLDSLEYDECTSALGLSVAFHTDHDLESSTEFCNTIKDQSGIQSCISGADFEIRQSELSERFQPPDDEREKVQPFRINADTIVDIRTPAIISGFEYNEAIKLMQFSIDRPSQIIMYIPENVLPEKYLVTVNGLVPVDIIITDNFFGQGIDIIDFLTKEDGIVVIYPRE